MSQHPDFIDVSKWQGPINWPMVASTGILGVIAKATEGTSIFDSQYRANREGALAAGLAFASYHYLHNEDPEGQMAWYLSKAAPGQGERIVLDYEEQDPEVKIDALRQAIHVIRRDRPDLQITVYGASKLTEDCDACEDTSFLAETSLWAARYSEVNQPTVPRAYPYWSAWQYTDEGQVKGVNGDCDLNTFNGSADACLEWFGPVSSLPEPEEPIEPAESITQVLRGYGQDITVQVGSDGEVLIWVNGEPWGP